MAGRGLGGGGKGEKEDTFASYSVIGRNGHFGPTQKFSAKENIQRSALPGNDVGDAQYQHPFIASCFLLTVTGPSSPDDIHGVPVPCFDGLVMSNT